MRAATLHQASKPFASVRPSASRRVNVITNASKIQANIDRAARIAAATAASFLLAGAYDA